MHRRHNRQPMRTCLLLALLAALPAWAAKPHEHGVARMDVGVEPRRISVFLELPLDTAVGFEREPRTDAERQLAQGALERLRDGAALFRIDPAARCTPAKAVVEAGPLTPGAAPAREGHDDLDASYEFTCADGTQAGFIEVGLFGAFARLQRVEVQAVTRKGQLKATLKRPTSRLPLAR